LFIPIDFQYGVDFTFLRFSFFDTSYLPFHQVIRCQTVLVSPGAEAPSNLLWCSLWGQEMFNCPPWRRHTFTNKIVF